MPGIVAAQATSNPGAEELRARLDVLRPQRERAQEEAEARQQRDLDARRVAAAAVATVDTIQVGPMTIVTPTDQVDMARELFGEVWEESFRLIESPEVEQAWFSFQWADSRVPIHIEEHPRPVELNSRWIRRTNVKRAIREVIAATINYDLSSHGTAVGRWLGMNMLLGPTDETIYRVIASTQSRSTRACLDGDRAECISSLSLNFGASPTWLPESTAEERRAAWDAWEQHTLRHLLSWYTADERRALAGQHRTRNRADHRVWLACVEDGRDDACDEYLMSRGQDLAPMNPSVRASFAAYALEQGGEGAWTRLLANPDAPPIEALEHASGQSIDELVGGWRARVIDARPDSFARLIPSSGLAVLWFVFFSAFALRSTRWRLG